MFLERVGNHTRCGINYDPSHFLLQALDYLEFIDIYHERIYAFHVKDAEFNPTGRQGVFSGFQTGSTAPAVSARSATARSTSAASSRSSPPTITTAGRCSSGSAASSTRRTARARGAEFIKHHIIRVTEKSFDDFAAGGEDQAANRRALGLDW